MKRVLILGNGGAGKSTFAKQLHEKTGLPLVHLDTIHWISEEERMDESQFDAVLTQILQKPEWIIDGNYRRTLPLRLQYADTVIFLDPPHWRSLWQAVKRYLAQLRMGKVRNEAGNPPTLTWKFVQWILFYPRQKMLDEILSHKTPTTKVYVIKSEKDRQDLILK